MICAGRDCVYAIFFVLCICAQSTAAIGKGDKEGNPVRPSPGAFPGVATPTEFQWNEHSKLSWEDFRGGISTMDDEAAAATHCGIGFKTNTRTSGDKPEIIVYNTFYVNKSWVRADAKLPEILLHEQGHCMYSSEYSCDLYALKQYLYLGYNASMAYYAMSHILKQSPENVKRIKVMFKNVMNFS